MVDVDCQVRYERPIKRCCRSSALLDLSVMVQYLSVNCT